jgi:AcrR family transcriptional regulator
MARPKGTRNADYRAARGALVAKISARLMASDGPSVSLRELSAAAGVSLATIRHYVGDRSGAIRAVLEHHHALGTPYLQKVAAEPLADLRTSVLGFLEFLTEGLRAGVSALLQVGIANGRTDSAVARACLTELLEPTLQALEIRLQRHVEAGHLRPLDVRLAALTLVSPVVLAVIHQEDLDGATYRALRIPDLLAFQAESFVRSHGR